MGKRSYQTGKAQGQAKRKKWIDVRLMPFHVIYASYIRQPVTFGTVDSRSICMQPTQPHPSPHRRRRR